MHPLICKYPFNKKENSKYASTIQLLFEDNVWIDENTIFQLQKIQSDCQKIKDLLSPLKKIGFKFNLGLCGGAIRDLVFKKTINDLDYVVSLDLNHIHQFFDSRGNGLYKNKTLIDFVYDLKLEAPEAENLYCHLVSSTASIESKVCLFLSYFFNKNKSLKKKEFFSHVTMEEKNFAQDLGNYPHLNVDNRLTGIIKISDEQFYHEIDLLITNDTLHNYIHTFDFGLSQIAIDLDKLNNDSLLQDYLNHIYCTPAFLDDYLNKKLTLTTQIEQSSFKEGEGRYERTVQVAAQNRTIEYLENAMNHYYPKIKNKYPEHQLSIPHTHYEEQTHWKNACLLNHTLQEKPLGSKIVKI